VARAFKYCLLCNPDENGLTGEEGSEAKGKYYLKKGKNQAFSGWIPICDFCCGMAERQGYEVVYFDDQEKKKTETCGNCAFEKKNLVTFGNDIRDIWKCKHCGREVRSLGNPKGYLL